jgi:hypothetical protein
MKSMLQVPVKPEVLHEIKVIAVEKETTLTNVVRESLLEYIAKNKHLLVNGVKLNECPAPLPSPVLIHPSTTKVTTPKVVNR